MDSSPFSSQEYQSSHLSLDPDSIQFSLGFWLPVVDFRWIYGSILVGVRGRVTEQMVWDGSLTLIWLINLLLYGAGVAPTI